MQRYIYYFGVWEPSISAWIARRLQPGDTFVDVGANIGYYTLLAARQVGPDGAVIAIEALPPIFEELQAHVRINSLANVRLVNVAATRAARDVVLHIGDKRNIGSTSMISSDQDSGETANIEGKPLSEILSIDEKRAARVIKIDVEGAEWEVIQGLKLDTDAYRTDIEFVMEVSPNRGSESGSNASDLMSHMQALGFNAYIVDNDHHFRSYLPSALRKRPVRLRGELTQMRDLIFSRIDADVL